MDAFLPLRHGIITLFGSTTRKLFQATMVASSSTFQLAYVACPATSLFPGRATTTTSLSCLTIVKSTLSTCQLDKRCLNGSFGVTTTPPTSSWQTMVVWYIHCSFRRSIRHILGHYDTRANWPCRSPSGSSSLHGHLGEPRPRYWWRHKNRLMESPSHPSPSVYRHRSECTCIATLTPKVPHPPKPLS